MPRFLNYEKMVSVSLPSWEMAAQHGLTDIRFTSTEGNKLVTKDGHRFINMVSCSYLGLNYHPEIIDGAIRALGAEGTMSISVSRARIAPALLDTAEEEMSKLFACNAMLTTSAASASSSVLPILASGHFTSQVKPLVIFDKKAHFSMNILKAACADEVEVRTCEHNDLNYIEDECKKNRCVAYITDGVFSMGGHTPINELLKLQDRFGLFLYLDDSHSLSVFGKNGVGFCRSNIDSLGDRTIIIGSLAKAFGATGGLIMLGNDRQKQILKYCGGPIGWSQMLSAPSLGAILASARLHQSAELKSLQEKLYQNLSFIDTKIKSQNSGNTLPIRIINIGDIDLTIRSAKLLFEQGFYCSPVFFPIVPRNDSGLRLMGRSNLDENDLNGLAKAFSDVFEQIALAG